MKPRHMVITVVLFIGVSLAVAIVLDLAGVESGAFRGGAALAASILAVIIYISSLPGPETVDEKRLGEIEESSIESADESPDPDGSTDPDSPTITDTGDAVESPDPPDPPLATEAGNGPVRPDPGGIDTLTPTRVRRRFTVFLKVFLKLILVLLIAGGLVVGEQWARSRTAASLIEAASDFASSGYFHRDVWKDELWFGVEQDHLITAENVEEFAEAYGSIGDEAREQLVTLIEIRLRVEGIFVLPWHRGGANAQDQLLEVFGFVEEVLREEASLFSFSPSPDIGHVVNSGNSMKDLWRVAVVDVCATSYHLEGQLHAAIPSAPWLWSGLHDEVPRLSNDPWPYNGLPWRCP